MDRIERAISRAIVLAAAIAFAAASPAAAEAQRPTGLKLSGDQPIQIESDKLEVREADKVAVFSGNVSVTQGTTVMKSGRMIVHYANDGGSAATGSAAIERLEVDGKVYVKSDDQVATGDRGNFDMKSEVLVLTGKEVVLSQGENVIVGCKLTVNMKSGQAQLDGCGGGGDSGGRIKMLITPGSAKKQ